MLHFVFFVSVRATRVGLMTTYAPIIFLPMITWFSLSRVTADCFLKKSAFELEGRSHSILLHQLFEFLSQLVQVVGGSLRLLGAGHVLCTRLFDAFHSDGHLVHSYHLLLA